MLDCNFARQSACESVLFSIVHHFLVLLVNLVAEWIHFTLFWRILPTIKLNV